jgi:RNA polymerase sigma-70 factor, ECF subfamily
LKLGFLQNILATRERNAFSDADGLYLRYQPGITRYLYYRTGDLQTAEDLTADVFVKMVQVLSTRQVEMEHLQAWLFQVARNLAIDHFRRISAHPHVELVDNLPAPTADLERNLDDRLTCSALARGLGQLEDVQRDVIVLRFIEGLPIAETARVLHKSEDAVKAVQRRGLMALRKLLDLEEISND